MHLKLFFNPYAKKHDAALLVTWHSKQCPKDGLTHDTCKGFCIRLLWRSYQTDRLIAPKFALIRF